MTDQTLQDIIREQLETLFILRNSIQAIRTDAEQQIMSCLTVEQAEFIHQIESRRDEAVAEFEKDAAIVEKEIKAAVIDAGETVKATGIMAVFTPGRPTITLDNAQRAMRVLKAQVQTIIKILQNDMYFAIDGTVPAVSLERYVDLLEALPTDLEPYQDMSKPAAAIRVSK